MTKQKNNFAKSRNRRGSGGGVGLDWEYIEEKRKKEGKKEGNRNR